MNLMPSPHAVRASLSEPVIIALMGGDDAIRYCAHLEAGGNDCFLVALHQSSLLLDKLRFKRELPCSVMFSDGRMFQGKLGLNDGGVVAYFEAWCAAAQENEAIVPCT